MAGENLVKVLQIAGAALGIPTAAAGSFAASSAAAPATATSRGGEGTGHEKSSQKTNSRLRHVNDSPFE